MNLLQSQMIRRKGAGTNASLPVAPRLLWWQILFFLFSATVSVTAAFADVGVQLNGPLGTVSQTLPGNGGEFSLNTPLRKNSVNKLTVTASDENGNTASRDVEITQISFDQLVVAQVKAEPLPPERVEQLVRDGVINLDDPANFNVSQFDIVLTIAQEPITFSIPIAISKGPEPPQGYETYATPAGDGGGGRPKDSPPVQIVVFEIKPSGPPGQILPSVPGIIVIEGRIKTLKEFFSVKFLVMNISGVFTLQDVNAALEFPDGGLSNTLPVDGMASLGNILPGSGTTPGQSNKEFIVRGDEKGTKRVKVNFGGKVAGPGISEGNEVPFNGSAETSIEVKGPPTFLVQVDHPDAVVAGVPYDLTIDITNTGETPALYSSLDLDVGFDAKLVDCGIDSLGEPFCTELTGPATRSFGHILPGQKVREVFRVKPLTSGAISSCMGIADQNITLQVNVSNLGCLTGNFPPNRKNPDGIPTVAVLPPSNSLGVSIDSPVALFFSEAMVHGTIRTGQGGTLNVYDRAGARQPGEIRKQELNGDTVAIWQFKDGITNRLAPNMEYTVEVSKAIKDLQGNGLLSDVVTKFTTTGTGIEDTTPPTLTLSTQPLVNPNNILPGQVVKISAYPADQGSGISRVELRVKDLDVPGSLYTLIDQKKFTLGDKFPFIFTLETKTLVPGHTYQLLGTAFDGVGNPGEATLALFIATSAPVPTVTLPTPDPAGYLRGVLIGLTPTEVTGGTYEVRYFLDGSATPFQKTSVAPYGISLVTKDFAVGAHSVRAVAVDGLNQQGEAFFNFEILENNFAPAITISDPQNGQDIVTGTLMKVSGAATDATGITGTKWFFDNPAGAPFAQNINTFSLNTTGIPLGEHRIYLVATNTIGLSNNANEAGSFVTFNIVPVPPEPAPPPPTFTNITPPSAGKSSFSGTTASNRRVDVTNPAYPGLLLTLQSNGAGQFAGEMDAEVGHTINAKAFNAAQQLASANASIVVPAPASVVSISATPETLNFNSFATFSDLTVQASYSDLSTQNVSTSATYLSNNPAVASVNAVGRVVPFSNGTATITVSFGGKTDTVEVTVDVFALVSIAVTPSPVLFDAVSQTAQLSVTGTFTDSSTQTLPTGTVFTTGDPAVAVVNPSGLITAQGAGSTTITASRSGVSPVSIPVTVSIDDSTQPIAIITSPSNDTDVERGTNVTISVLGTDIGGSGVTKLQLETTGQAIVTDLKQFAATQSTNQSFAFVVPASATIGGIITVQVTAEDAVGNTSAVASITLNVVDTTAPTASITSPALLQGFNFGDTVTVTINASDSVGVTQIRYTAEGGVSFSGTQNFAATPGQQSATFNFVIPFGVVNPDVRIRAFAKDAANNETQAAPVDIVITSADITPPETVATAVNPPGSGSTTNVSFSVTEGLADLDYVVLYFRRNGLGTFNRYTNAAGGNPEGKFQPTSGSNGTIPFDSSRMGGDGSYEFYTVGYDLAGNREADPVTADQSTAFSSGTAVTVISSNTAISASDFAFDNQNLRITGNVIVTVDGAHTFRNVELLGGAKLVHTAATISSEPGMILTLWSLSIDSSSSIDLTGLGYRGGFNSGNPTCLGLTLGNTNGATSRSAGSYGGLGGAIEGTPNSIYGSLADPLELGSGGSCGAAGGGSPGGNGGGRIAISAINLANDGTIASDGQNSPAGFGAGNGSGGAIKISASTVSGNGIVRANGNATSAGQNEVGGGGGRVAVLFTDISTLDRTKVRALGGTGNTRLGTNGTVFFSGLGETNGTLIIDGQGANTPFTPLSIPNGFTFDNITLRNNARVTIDTPLSITGTFSVVDNSIVSHSVELASGLVINADKVVVDSTSSIDATGRGFKGGFNSGNGNCTGNSVPGSVGASSRSGGSHGGAGGVVEGSGSNIPYGNIKEPSLLGAGGSCGAAGGGSAGGNGGGRISINAASSLTVDGSVRADGQNSLAGFAAGNGAGGSIKITTSNLKGSGFISANGQAVSGGPNEVGGGGGRIAIFYDFLGLPGNDLNGTRNITATGGKGNIRRGSAGSFFMKRSDQIDGVLYLDENMPSAQTSAVVAPVGTHIGFGRVSAVTSDTIFPDFASIYGVVPFAQNGLVGLTIQPNTIIDERYTIIANTSTSITVDISSKPPLTSVTSTGGIYHGAYRFDDVVLRRGAFAMLGDKLFVNNKLHVTENSFLSHYDATLNFMSRLDVDAGTVEIDAGSRIDASGRGYLGGFSAGNSNCTAKSNPALTGAQSRSGGSYGGFGGVQDGAGTNSLYGSVSDPNELGSGGSCGSAGGGSPGGDGGGFIHILASELIVNGELASSGARSAGFQAGNGSGGSINLNVGTLSGSGFVRANGETSLFGGANEVGGGGGRVAIRYNTLNLTPSQMQVLGGIGSSRVGGHGTLFLKGPGQALGDLVIDGQSTNTSDDLSALTAVIGFDNIILRNNARLSLEWPLVAGGAIQLLSGSRITHPIMDEDGAQLFASSLLVDETSTIDVTGRGYRGGFNGAQNPACQAISLGGQPGALYRSAGSYGGAGGVVEGAGSNPIYGIPEEPIYLGSGGSCGSAGGGSAGGNGGGRIEIALQGNAIINGAIRADGQNSLAGFQAGNGSGGSVKISAQNISGAGVISANGQAVSGGPNEVGGGGGRVALFYSTFGGAAGDFNGTLNISAFGGFGNTRTGSAGTVYLKSSSNMRGDVIIDAGLNSGTTNAASTFTRIGFGSSTNVDFEVLGLDGTRPVIAGGLVGVKIRPSLAISDQFAITSNTNSEVTLDTGGNDLTALVSAGDFYAAVHTFRTLTLRRGARLELDDVLVLEQTLAVTDRSVVTHRPSTLDSTSRAEILANALNLDATSSIDVSARGYLGGFHGGNSSCEGRTLFNASGSTFRSGGSYGGLGGSLGGTPNSVYGEASFPAALGSGGSCGAAGGGSPGGNGGGWISGVFNTAVVNGDILANGQNSPSGFGAGNGSGGSINLTIGNLSGAGNIRANGNSASGGFNETGGGGGRIRISATTNTLSGAVTANGGNGSQVVGQVGTTVIQ